MNEASETILERARAHFDAMRGQEIDIPEWGGADGPLLARFDPPTLSTRQRIQTRAGKSEARLCALVVIVCLKDVDGKPLFKDDAATLADLMSKVDPAVVARISARILHNSSADDLGNS